jgi:hypothetical protein
MPGIPNEVVVGERIDAPVEVGWRQTGEEYIQSVKPYITMEKIVEVPQTIIKESTRHVPKPEIVERIIEVPKLAYNERTIKAPAKSRYRQVENIAEVERGVITEVHQTHIPKTEIQERLIEIPRIEYREKIEYEDRIEYREVPVEKIVEVPQIEYVVREVERYVPQTYVQEYYVPRYTEVPIQQIQEVERQEVVPVIQPVPRYKTMPVPVRVPVQAPTIRMDGNMQASMGSMPFGPPGSMPFGPPFAAGGPMGSVANAYASYDPTRPGMDMAPPGMASPLTMPSGVLPPGPMAPGMMPPSYPQAAY